MQRKIEEEKAAQRKLRCAKYYKKHRDEILAKRKESRMKNKDEISRKNKEYRMKNKDKMDRKNRKYRIKNKDEINRKKREKNKNPEEKKKTKFKKIKKIYGLEKKDYYKLADDQNRMCPICKRAFDKANRIVVDHDHETGLTRGLLCASCNLLLGHAAESIERLSSAIDYLNKHKNFGLLMGGAGV